MDLALIPAIPGTDNYTAIARINDEAVPDSELLRIIHTERPDFPAELF